MTDISAESGFLAALKNIRQRPEVENEVVLQALSADKREGLKFAVRARWAALSVVALLLPYLNLSWSVIYYELILIGFALIGWAQLKVGELGRSRRELALLFCDLALMTYTMVVPNPLSENEWPIGMQYRFGSFIYFYIILAGAALAYSWRTLFAVGFWTTGLWMGGLIWASYQPAVKPELSQAVLAALAHEPDLAAFLDPASLNVPGRVQDVVVFLIIAVLLAVNSWRANRLLLRQAAGERARSNLARYFSPNVVEELSQNDEPLKRVRTQDVAVMFVDMVGFTRMASEHEPRQVIEILRQFHGRMEAEVFRHQGTLDKYLGDGLMATFGTPFAGSADAGNALRCAFAMTETARRWNAERRARGEAEIMVSVGVHYGEVVLGDIGASRLEFAVIGDTVNIASRLERLTRELQADLVVSDALVRQAASEPEPSSELTARLVAAAPQRIKGLAETLPVWSLPKSAQAA